MTTLKTALVSISTVTPHPFTINYHQIFSFMFDPLLSFASDYPLMKGDSQKIQFRMVNPWHCIMTWIKYYWVAIIASRDEWYCHVHNYMNGSNGHRRQFFMKAMRTNNNDLLDVKMPSDCCIHKPDDKADVCELHFSGHMQPVGRLLAASRPLA